MKNKWLYDSKVVGKGDRIGSTIYYWLLKGEKGDRGSVYITPYVGRYGIDGDLGYKKLFVSYASNIADAFKLATVAKRKIINAMEGDLMALILPTRDKEMVKLVQTEAQRKALDRVLYECALRHLHIASGTTIGEAPQTIVIDLSSKGGEIKIYPNGKIDWDIEWSPE